jgi:hypothetical protein
LRGVLSTSRWPEPRPSNSDQWRWIWLRASAAAFEPVDALEEATRRYIQAVRDPDDGREARLPARVLQVADLGAMQAGAIA